MNNKTILDVCCGSRMFYFDKHNKNTIYMDCSELDETLCDGRNLVIAPDVVGDFRSIPFPDETFNLVIFDPPHLLNAGDASWLAKKYGKLDKNWKEDIRTGFNEACFFPVLQNLQCLFICHSSPPQLLSYCFACSMIFENDNCYEYCEQLIGGIVEKAIQEAEEKEKENV